MHGDGDLDNDDYVAKLLAEDAERSSIKYATAGLSAFLPGSSRRPGPKPNTRFLSHLVRDVDSHNAALRRKEEQDARARIEGYRLKEREQERARAHDLARTQQRKHRQDSQDERKRSSKHRRRRSSSESESMRERHHDHKRHRSLRHVEVRDEDESTKSKSRRQKERRRSPRRQNNRPHRKSEAADSSGARDNNRDKTSRGRCSRASPPDRRSHDRHPRPASPHPAKSDRRSDSDSDSDPLEALVGPLPPPSVNTKDATSNSPVRIRGRGAHRLATSSIDAHFSPGYDPSADTGAFSRRDHGDTNDDDDWDLALSALRDRSAWKRKQSERLREAGFTDEEIRKWERSSTVSGLDGGAGGGDRDLGDVKWGKKGEDREWDVGKKKVDREEPEVELGPSKSRPECGSENDGRLKKQDGWGRSSGGLLKRFTNALKQ